MYLKLLASCLIATLSISAFAEEILLQRTVDQKEKCKNGSCRIVIVETTVVQLDNGTIEKRSKTLRNGYVRERKQIRLKIDRPAPRREVSLDPQGYSWESINVSGGAIKAGSSPAWGQNAEGGMIGYAGSGHHMYLRGNRVDVGEGSGFLGIGLSKKRDEDSAAFMIGLEAEGEHKSGYMAGNVVQIYGIGGGEGHFQLHLNPIKNNRIGLGVGVEGGIAVVTEPVAVMLGIPFDVAGELVVDEEDYIEGTTGAVLRVAIVDKVYLKAALKNSIFSTMSNTESTNAELTLNVAVAKLGRPHERYNTATGEVERVYFASLMIGIHGEARKLMNASTAPGFFDKFSPANFMNGGTEGMGTLNITVNY